MSTPGYTSIAKTKESGTPSQPIPAQTWTLVDIGMVECVLGPNIVHSQLYFDKLTGAKLVLRVQRGSGNATAQQDYTVDGKVWAVAYTDIDFVTPADRMRGIEVWADEPCVIQTRVLKIVRPLAIDGETT